MDRIEILTGVERRRRWSEEAKLRILRDAFEPGASITEVARRHEVSRSQIYQWRRAFAVGRRRSGGEILAGDKPPAEGRALVDFVPVEVEDGLEGCGASAEPGPFWVTIGLRGGRSLRVPSNLARSEIERLMALVEAA